MKCIYLSILLVSMICCISAFPVTEPIIGEKYGNPEYSIELSGNRVASDVSIVCADSLSIYVEISKEVLLRIAKKQIVSISPELPQNMDTFIYREYAESYDQWDSSSIRMIDLKPTCKYIVQAAINDIDSCGGVSVRIILRNLSKNRLKYAVYTVKYYNAVDDVLSSEISGNSSMRCKATGFIEPGTIDSGYWSGFYNTTASYLKITAITLTYASNKQEIFQRNSASVQIIEN